MKKYRLLLAAIIGFLPFVYFSVSGQNLQDGLIGHYLLDGDTADASGNGNSGTIVGDPVFVSGVTGSGLLFDGTDDYVELSNESNFDLSELTIAATIYVLSTENNNAVISKGIEFGNYRDISKCCVRTF